jgi:hypothetical protein
MQATASPFLFTNPTKLNIATYNSDKKFDAEVLVKV